MKDLLGIGKLDRKRLGEVLRGTKGTISVSEASGILKLSSIETAKILARWARKGWLSRVRRGLYVAIPIESRSVDVALEYPWLIAEKLYSPCYIGGWSAAEHWGLTEQIFRDIVVMTRRNPRKRSIVIKGTQFLLRTVPAKAMFGAKPVWKGQVKISVSDPARTIIDMLCDPGLGGGIRSVADMFANYLKSADKNTDLLLEYASRLGIGAVFKRLGFILERFAPAEKTAINACFSKLTKGNARLDASLGADRLITRWRLWVPESWADDKGRQK